MFLFLRYIDRFSNLTWFVRILFLYVVDFRDLTAHTMRRSSSFRLYLILSEIQAEIDAIYSLSFHGVAYRPFLAGSKSHSSTDLILIV